MADNLPELTISVMRGSEPYEVKMTYGLEMDLRRVLPDPSSAISLSMMDADTQDYVIRRCLTEKRTAITDVAQLIPVEEVDISTEDGDRLILWALEHQLYFFAKRAQGMMALAARQQTKVPQHLSNTGSETSPSETPSAGPSDASKETSETSTGDTPTEK